ncbi:hypothetical protein L7F22_035641 [Adiantum nelumboides]|nr:hypothetical protein [Adiantum nelumboides]
MAPVSPMNASAAHRGQGNQDQQDLLNRITHQLEDLSVQLVRGGRGPPPNQEQARGPRRQAQEYHCCNCGENGHGMYYCPHPRRIGNFRTVEDTFPLVLQHMDVSAGISKWLVWLQEFEYTVQVENSTRASLAGMLTHRCYERKVKVKAPGPEPVEVQAKLCGAHSLYFDGAYKQKVDKASVGISIQDDDGQKVFGKGLLVENTHSNNEAEYDALALGLEWCVSMGIKRLNVFGALLLIKQMHGTWACRNQSLVPRLRRVKELMKRFEAI